MENRKKILERIKKLIKKQESAQEIGSIQEAEAFALKISELTTKYNIQMTDIEFKEVKGNVIQENLSTKIKSVSDTLGWQIMYPIAKYNFCRVYKTTGAFNMVIIGLPENIEICKSIYEIVLKIFIERGKLAYKFGNIESGLDTFQREFLRGCGVGLDMKFKAERDRLKSKEIQTTALILRSETAVAEYAEKHLNLTKGRKQSFKKTGAFDLGVITGKNVEINKKIK